ARKRDLPLVGEHGVRSAGQEHLEHVAPPHEWNQDAGAHKGGGRIDVATRALAEDLLEPLKTVGGGDVSRRRWPSPQVHASNETGTWRPQWVHTQTCPRRTTDRPSPG